MLNLENTGSALDGLHRRFLDDAFPPELSTAAFSALSERSYTEEERQDGRAAWELRALDEYRSQVGFTELLMELTELGFAFDVLGVAVRIVRDEARHVELCRRMVRALGGSGVIDQDPVYVRSDPAQPLMKRVLHTVVGSLCGGETFSVRILAAVREETRDPTARAVVTCLAADESIHSQFGWTLLRLLVPHLSDSDRAEISELLPGVLAACESLMTRPDTSGGEHALAAATVNPFGCLSDRRRNEVFHDSLERDVLRRFAELGFDARAAWDARHRST